MLFKRLFIAITLILLLCAYACSSNKVGNLAPQDSVESSKNSTAYDGAGGIEQKEMAVDDDITAAADGNVTNNTNNQQPSNTEKLSNSQKIIKVGNIDFEVNAIERAKKRIDSLVVAYNAYYANEDLNSTQYSSTYILNIRIPTNKYEAFVAVLKEGIGKITNYSIDAKDITEQYSDTQTRLANKRAYLARYKEILKKATSIEDILKVEEVIRGLEEEIESKEGKLRYYDNKVAFGTLQIRLTELREVKDLAVNTTNFFRRLGRSFISGWHSVQDIIVFLVGGWPFWLIAFLAGFFFYRNNKSFIKKR